jgi:hypothetical protein
MIVWVRTPMKSPMVSRPQCPVWPQIETAEDGAKFEILALHRMAPTNRRRRPSHFYAALGKYDLWRIGRQRDLVGDRESSRLLEQYAKDRPHFREVL